MLVRSYIAVRKSVQSLKRTETRNKRRESLASPQSESGRGVVIVKRIWLGSFFLWTMRIQVWKVCGSLDNEYARRDRANQY
jgi:hypothetical protein